MVPEFESTFKQMIVKPLLDEQTSSKRREITMNSYTYTWFHIATGKSDMRTVKSRLTTKEFYDVLCKWNTSQKRFLYAPVC